MRYHADRKFTLLDLLTLVAATAVGLGTMRGLSPDNDIFFAPYSPIPSPTWVNWVSISATNWAFYLSPLVTAWTVGILILRLRNPRPSLHRLARQPGFVACCTATVAVGLGAIMTVIGVSRRYGVYYYFHLATYPVGVAILAAWTLLAVSGRWRPEGNLDRPGGPDHGLCLAGNGPNGLGMVLLLVLTDERPNPHRWVACRGSLTCHHAESSFASRRWRRG